MGRDLTAEGWRTALDATLVAFAEAWAREDYPEAEGLATVALWQSGNLTAFE
jgi:hypothetical protein